MPPYTDTIDWDEYWDDADGGVREDTGPSADLVAEPFFEFLRKRTDDGPASCADVGCGPGHLAFEAAERYGAHRYEPLVFVPK
jgi:SAM-dependent methyltransferase